MAVLVIKDTDLQKKGFLTHGDLRKSFSTAMDDEPRSNLMDRDLHYFNGTTFLRHERSTAL